MDQHTPTASELERKQLQVERSVARKKGIQRAVKDVREKITSSSGLRRSFEFELARSFAQNHISALVALLPLAVMMAGSTLLWASAVTTLIWFGLAVAALCGQYLVCKKFLAAESDDSNFNRWINRLITSDVVVVFVWALLPVIVGVPQSDGLRHFILFSMLMMGAVTAVISHSLPRAVYSSVPPIAVAMFVIAFGLGQTERWLILALAFTSLALFLVLANRLYATTLDTLSARAEKDDAFVEVEQANLRLTEARKRAEDANAAKSKFLATMSHELRTPLNAILGFAEIIKDETFGPVGNERYKSYIGDIHSSGAHLLALINEVLDLSRIEAGKHELQEEAIDLVDAVAECIHMLELRASGRGLKIRTAFTENMPRLWADERAIRQIVLNLLSNAIKFTPQGAEIRVKVGWTQSGGQYFAIRDNGPGIPEDEIATVLSTFGRGSQAIKNADQGSGLGLPIVKNLVELHGGAFRLTSKVREGTEATAMFPPARVMTAMAALDPNAPQKPQINIRRRPKAA
jgi:two-component system, cell cycle sensor histidine kinase PleC